MRLTATTYGREYYDQHAAAGLDYLGHGYWQANYAAWIVDALGLRGKHVFDVGCACGSILRGFGEAGAYVCGCDLSEEMIELGRQKWPDQRPLMRVCDAVNLHYYADDLFDLVHSAQVAEHWRPELVELILAELRRIAKPGGRLLCFLDTAELCEKHHRDPAAEDPTHICIRPLAWWHDRLQAAGWQVLPADRPPASTLHDHAASYFRSYDWGWFLAQNGEPPERPAAESEVAP